MRTVLVDDAGPLLDLLPATADVTAWVRRGEGLVGWGTAAVCRTHGPEPVRAGPRVVDATWPAAPWSATRPALPGTGLVCFGSFAFADEPGDSVLVVPEVVVGRRGRRHLGDHDRRRHDPRAPRPVPVRAARGAARA